MATGVIRNLTDFKFPTPFCISFLQSSLQEDTDFQESEEEELLEDEEMEDEVVDLNPISPEPRMGPTDPHTREDNTEMTEQLLKFSELISSDIQRYFGPKNKEEDPDSCNIYEDHFKPPMSGQEMYYQDLVRMAQNRHDDTNYLFNPLTPPGEVDKKMLKSICNKQDPKKLGPLSELFDFGLRQYTKQKVATIKESKKHRLDKKYAHIVPMHRRSLPMSFWKEPSPAPLCILHTNTPDFSDLLENWTSDTHSELQSASRDLIGEFSR